MNKREYKQWVKGLLAEMKEGYYGEVEFIDELADKRQSEFLQYKFIISQVNKLKKVSKR